jgi:chromate transporter
MQFKENQHVEYAFQGVRIGVAVLILNAGMRMFRKLDKNLLSYILILIGFGLLLFHILSVIYVILIGGAIGIIAQLVKLRGERHAL